jgi:hypothetical protein
MSKLVLVFSINSLRPAFSKVMRSALDFPYVVHSHVEFPLPPSLFYDS